MTASTHHQPAATTHDRRHAHAQARGQDPDPLPARRAPVRRVPRALTGHGQPPQQEKRIEHAVSDLAVIKGEPLKFSVTVAVTIAAFLLSDQRPDAEQLLVHAPLLAAELRFKDLVWHGDELVMHEGHRLVLAVRLT